MDDEEIYLDESSLGLEHISDANLREQVGKVSRIIRLAKHFDHVLCQGFSLQATENGAYYKFEGKFPLDTTFYDVDLHAVRSLYPLSVSAYTRVDMKEKVMILGADISRIPRHSGGRMETMGLEIIHHNSKRLRIKNTGR